MQFENIVVLTGAGISAESGVKTFRDNNGLWENHRVEEVATPEAFARHPDLVYRFYNQRRAQLKTVRPNRAHIALAEFAQGYSGQLTLITQNVDDLHERGGSPDVLHIHGELNKARCVNTGHVFAFSADFDASTACPCCRPSARIRPHIVWFGEVPLSMDIIEQRLASADLFVAIGTSGHVYPAAGFVQMARDCGAKTVELNLAPSQVSSVFDQAYYGLASEIVPQFFANI